MDYRTAVCMYPSPCSPFRIVDDAETLAINRVIEAFERLYISDCTNSNLVQLKAYSSNQISTQMVDWMQIVHLRQYVNTVGFGGFDTFTCASGACVSTHYYIVLAGG